MTVLAESGAGQARFPLAAFKVSYVAGDGGERQVPRAEATAVRFELAMPVRRFIAQQG